MKRGQGGIIRGQEQETYNFFLKLVLIGSYGLSIGKVKNLAQTNQTIQNNLYFIKFKL